MRPLGREQARESARFGHSDEENREKTITEAVELAKTVDTVVLALGELPEQSGEAKSRANIRIPEVQLELYRRVRAVSKRVIVLVYTGRPLDLTAIQDADAIHGHLASRHHGKRRDCRSAVRPRRPHRPADQWLSRAA